MQQSSWIKLKIQSQLGKCKKHELKITLNFFDGGLVFILHIASNGKTEIRRNVRTFATKEEGERNTEI
jgi:hypothetical protein